MRRILFRYTRCLFAIVKLSNDNGCLKRTFVLVSRMMPSTRTWETTQRNKRTRQCMMHKMGLPFCYNTPKSPNNHIFYELIANNSYITLSTGKPSISSMYSQRYPQKLWVSSRCREIELMSVSNYYAGLFLFQIE